METGLAISTLGRPNPAPLVCFLTIYLGTASHQLGSQRGPPNPPTSLSLAAPFYKH